MAKRTRPVNGKVVAITGAARGIGRATAQALARRGARVAIGDLDVELARGTAEEIGGGTVAFAVNVTDRESVENFIVQTEEHLGPIDVFINNAGIMPIVRFLEETPESVERQFAVNVYGVIHGMQLVIPRMIERGRGHVINIASSAGKFGGPGVATYCGTKHAVVGLTDSIRIELKDQPIDFSMVMPGVVRTELTSGVPDTRGVKPVQPEDIAEAIVEAIETGRYEVFVPKSISAVYKASRLLPLGANDAILKLVGADKALVQAIDSPERLAYKRRTELAGGDRPQLPAGRETE